MSRRSPAWLMVVLAMTVVVAGLRYYYSDTADQRSRGVPVEPVPARGNSRSDSIASTGLPSAGARSETNVAQTAHQTSPPNPSQRNQNSENTASSNGQASVSTSPDDAAPDSVIGRPFGVSASVEEECKRLGEQDAICKGFHRGLERFIAERRDPVWANRMEAALREQVKLEPGKFTIRNLECRTTICAIELQSVSRYLGYAGPDHLKFERAQGIYLDELTHGYEYTEQHERVTITAATFVRK